MTWRCLMNALHERGLVPLDLAAVQADDALLNGLSDADLDEWLRRQNNVLVAGITAVVDVDAALRALLVAARRDVDGEPVGELVDVDTATAIVRSAPGFLGWFARLVLAYRRWVR